LKHSLNQDIAYGKSGMNANQIQTMQSINDDSRKQISAELTYISKSWWLFPNWFWVVGLLAGGGVTLYFPQLYALIGGLIVICYCVGQLAYRTGFQYGYIEGFESGHKNGVNTAIGITPEEDKEIQERSIEMKMDKRLIKNLDERKND
jgi:hypothetical protein